LATDNGAGFPKALEHLAAVAGGAPLLDLRTGALARSRCTETRRLARHCVAAALALALASAVAIHVQRHRLEQAIARVDAQRLQIYRGVFPDAERLPPGAALRLASERIRLEALTRPSQRGAEEGLAPLAGLREFVATLPQETRILLLEARLDARQWSLRGQTVEHRDAERIAEALGKVRGIRAHSPRTTRHSSGGVEFTVSGHEAVALERTGR
jgi:hypothetical protein